MLSGLMSLCAMPQCWRKASAWNNCRPISRTKYRGSPRGLALSTFFNEGPRTSYTKHVLTPERNQP